MRPSLPGAPCGPDRESIDEPAEPAIPRAMIVGKVFHGSRMGAAANAQESLAAAICRPSLHKVRNYRVVYVENVRGLRI